MDAPDPNLLNSPCPVCKGKAERESFHDGSTSFQSIDCERCGHYEVAVQCLRTLDRMAEPYRVSGVLRDLSERGEPLRVTFDNIHDIGPLAPTSVKEKVRRLLHTIARKSDHPGDTVTLGRETDYPLAFAKNDDELSLLLKHIKGLSWLKVAADSGGFDCELTGDGWLEVESDRASNAESDKAFVAMWFDPSVNDAYHQGIKLAVEEDAGYRSIRIDAVEHTGKIDDRIIAEIRESRFLIADFTGQRGGVYFEAGFAMGFGLPVIWLCREDEIGKVHFDTRQYNHIVWKEPGDLREKLAVRIRATVGMGPNADRRKSGTGQDHGG